MMGMVIKCIWYFGTSSIRKSSTIYFLANYIQLNKSVYLFNPSKLQNTEEGLKYRFESS